MNDNQILLLKSIGVILIIYILFKSSKKVLQVLNIVDDEKDVIKKKAIYTYENAVDPNFYKGKNDLISISESQNFAKRLDDAFGFFNTNEEEIVQVFHDIPNIQSISFVTNTYNRKYGKNLKQKIEDDFGTNWKKQPISALGNIGQFNMILNAIKRKQ